MPAKSSSCRSSASFCSSLNASGAPWPAHVSASTAGRSASRSTAMTAFARSSNATVIVPMPGPTSSTTSSGPTSAVERILPTTPSVIKKCCPSACFVAKPCASSTERVAATDASDDTSGISVPFFCSRCADARLRRFQFESRNRQSRPYYGHQRLVTVRVAAVAHHI